jgi:hypothetical protein
MFSESDQQPEDIGNYQVFLASSVVAAFEAKHPGFPE